MDTAQSLMKYKLKATLIHLLISGVVATLVFLLISLGWYRGMSEALGVYGIALLVIMVDLVLGPMLTFVVFNPAKKSLKFDLLVIALIQLAGLVYGMHSIYQARPAWVVFVQDRFEVVRPADVEDPYVVGTQVPMNYLTPVWASIPYMDQATKDEYFTKVVQGEPDVAYRVQLFDKLEDSYAEVVSHARPLNELHDYNSLAQVDRILGEHPWATHWLPLQTPVSYKVVLLGADYHTHAPKVVMLEGG